jgi:signal transduction histidine kinase
VTLLLSAFASGLALAMGVLGYLVNESYEDLIWHSALEAEFAHYIKYGGLSLDPAVQITDVFAIYRQPLGGTAVATSPPPAIARLAPGVHDGVQVDDRQYTVLVNDLDEQRFFMVYDITELEMNEMRLTTLVALGIGGVAAAIVFFSYRLARRVVAPVQDLAQRVSAFDPQARGIRVGPRYCDSEIAIIAGAIDRYMDRLDSFVLREQEFVNTASHELRTPIAIIAGAVDVLNATPGLPTSTNRPLARINHAARGMLDTITALLFLAKECTTVVGGEILHLDALLQQAIEDHRSLCADRKIAIRVLSIEPVQVDVPARLAYIVLANLLRNAIEHASHGPIEISLRADALNITNSAVALSAGDQVLTYRARAQNDSGGTGLGIAIVRRVCDRLGWQVEWNRSGNFTVVARLNIGKVAVHTNSAGAGASA